MRKGASSHCSHTLALALRLSIIVISQWIIFRESYNKIELIIIKLKFENIKTIETYANEEN